MCFKLSLGDPDIWMWPATKQSGEEYYEYVLFYVDAILVISMSSDLIMEDIKGRFRLENNEVKNWTLSWGETQK